MSEIISNPQTTTATFYGVGVGPGDPTLITLKAHGLITRTSVIAYLCNEQGHSLAREIARDSISQNQVTALVELPITMPMGHDRSAANARYDDAAEQIAKYLKNGCDVVFLCEGDGFFFGSFAYLFERLAHQFSVEVIPGITSIQASSSALARPLSELSENVAIISGRSSDQQMQNALGQYDNVVIMKPGKQRPRILANIAAAGRIKEGCYIEYTGQSKQRIVADLNQLESTEGPYFSMFIIQRRYGEKL